MKIVIFSGGLGNQIFEYALSLYLRKQTNCRIGFLKKTGKQTVDNVFDLDLFSVFEIDYLGLNSFEKYKYYLHKLISKLLNRYTYIATEEHFSLSAKYFVGWWQDMRYFVDLPENWIKFRDFKLSNQNKCILNKIKSTNSVAIHIRRGDYLLPQFVNIYGNICTEEYYKKAIRLMIDELENPFFFIFSNDIEWVEDNFNLPNSEIISWNQGSNSFIDMYLMSKCDANIIANSSFSYWGAYLGSEKKRVIYPQKWYHSTFSAPDIFPNHWVGI